MAICHICRRRYNWVSVANFFMNYFEPYIRCHQCFSEEKMKPKRRSVIGWTVLIFGFLLSFFIMVAVVKGIAPEGISEGGVFGAERPIGEKDTYRDTMYSEVRNSAIAQFLGRMNANFFCGVMALVIFTPFKRIFDFYSVGLEQKRNGLGSRQ